MLAALSLLGNDLRQGSAKKALGKEEVLVIRKKAKIKRITSQKIFSASNSTRSVIFTNNFFPIKFSRDFFLTVFPAAVIPSSFPRILSPTDYFQNYEKKNYFIAVLICLF
jgi:hypothetical protein